jgi:hypothetical protein
MNLISVETIAVSDYYNNLEKISASRAGLFFRLPRKIKAENRDVRGNEEFDELHKQ